jgi:hypothetical protein
MLNLPIKNKGQNVEVIACDKCRCSWLTKLKVNRYSTLPQALAMEPINIHFEGDFNLLLCAACGNVVFPPVEGFMTASANHQLYAEMAEEISGSKEAADERLAGIQKELIAKGVFRHVPEKPDHKGYYQEQKEIKDAKKEK